MESFSDNSGPAVAVVTEAGQVAMETGAPTPAPTNGGSGGASFPTGAVVGAVFGVAAVAAVAVRRAKLRKSAGTGSNIHAPAEDGVQMAAGSNRDEKQLSNRSDKDDATNVM